MYVCMYVNDVYIYDVYMYDIYVYDVYVCVGFVSSDLSPGPGIRPGPPVALYHDL